MTNCADHEKVLMEKTRPMANNPPSEPYDVKTSEKLIAVAPKEPFILLNENHNFDIELHLDVHIETASVLPLRFLKAIMTATEERKCIKYFNKMQPTFIEVEKETKMELSVLLDYPLDNIYNFKVETIVRRGGLSVGDIIYAICQAYRAAYLAPKHYGIWGHALSDLFIERIQIDIAKKWIYPIMGS